jgi:hypothetical protein
MHTNFITYETSYVICFLSDCWFVCSSSSGGARCHISRLSFYFATLSKHCCSYINTYQAGFTCICSNIMFQASETLDIEFQSTNFIITRTYVPDWTTLRYLTWCHIHGIYLVEQKLHKNALACTDRSTRISSSLCSFLSLPLSLALSLSLPLFLSFSISPFSPLLD